jgi:hypothetical protein
MQLLLGSFLWVLDCFQHLARAEAAGGEEKPRSVDNEKGVQAGMQHTSLLPLLSSCNSIMLYVTLGVHR